MSDSFDISEVIRRTGLTSRALRFYEARGLIAPVRTASGRRHYGAHELERLHRLLALKRAGLSLADIKKLFDHKAIDLAALLRAQRDSLDAQVEKLAAARNLITTALSRIDHGAPVDAATFCALIQQGDIPMSKSDMNKVVSQYWSPQAKMQFGLRMKDMFDGFNPQEYGAKWAELGSRIKAALPIDPESEQALALVREWNQLLEPFTRVATKEMWQSSHNMYENMDKWQSPTADPGFDKQVWDFIKAATTFHRAAGHDIGHLPDFVRG